MLRKWWLPLVVALCLTSRLSAAPGCEEQLSFSFDDRPWELGFYDTQGTSSIVEYVLKGETVENWKELVTVQRLPPIQKSIRRYYDDFVASLKQSTTSYQVHVRQHQRSLDSLFFEWWIDAPNPNAQHEWFRLITTKESTLILRYTTKNLADVEKVRPEWESILEKATVTTPEECAQQ